MDLTLPDLWYFLGRAAAYIVVTISLMGMACIWILIAVNCVVCPILVVVQWARGPPRRLIEAGGEVVQV